MLAQGDPAGFVHILDEKTLAIPDRPGNNRIDGFRNIVRDPRIALFFLIPGVGETLRVNGRASISTDPELMQSFAVNGKLPRCVLIVHIETIYFHCAKAIVRSKLSDKSTKIDRKSLPSTGTIIAELIMESLAAKNMIVKRRSGSRRSFIDSGCRNVGFERVGAFSFQPIHGYGKDEIKSKRGDGERCVRNRWRTKEYISLCGHSHHAEDKHAIATYGVFPASVDLR